VLHVLVPSDSVHFLYSKEEKRTFCACCLSNSSGEAKPSRSFQTKVDLILRPPSVFDFDLQNFPFFQYLDSTTFSQEMGSTE
jgi:hypothetical protein